MPQAGTTAGSKSSTQKQRELIFCNENKSWVRRRCYNTFIAGARWASEGGACKEFYFRTEFIFPPRWENYLVGWCGEGKAAKGIFQVSESERITNRKTHQWFARRSRILSDSRNKTQADTNRLSRMPICISGLTHSHHLTFISLAYWEQVAHNDNQHGLYHTEKTHNMVMKARGN